MYNKQIELLKLLDKSFQFSKKVIDDNKRIITYMTILLGIQVIEVIIIFVMLVFYGR